jgi:hypothetical protein
MAAFLAAGTGWTYDPDAAIPAGVTPLGVAALPEGFDTAAAVTTYPGGPEPDVANGWEYPRMQVRVRAVNPLDALELDRAAFDVLQGAGDVTLPGGVWFLQDCYALQSEAQPLGQDENGRWEFVRNYQLSTELA